MDLDAFFYSVNLVVVFVVAIVLIMGTSEAGEWFGLRSRRAKVAGMGATGTLAGAALGLLALLIAFSFSIALSRYDGRREAVNDEANAIGTAANYAAMLPLQAQKPILMQLRAYAEVRIGLSQHYDPSTLNADVALSNQILSQLWREARAVTAAQPQSLPAYRFVKSLSALSDAQEERLSGLRTHLPVAVVAMLIGTSMVAMGFVGYHAGFEGIRRIVSRLVMSLTIAALITLIIDLDRPSRGLIQVSVQPLVDAARELPP
jgi:hypothetical protein